MQSNSDTKFNNYISKDIINDYNLILSETG